MFPVESNFVDLHMKECRMSSCGGRVSVELSQKSRCLGNETKYKKSGLLNLPKSVIEKEASLIFLLFSHLHMQSIWKLISGLFNQWKGMIITFQISWMYGKNKWQSDWCLVMEGNARTHAVLLYRWTFTR